MKNIVLLFLFGAVWTYNWAQTHVYLIPGQGADERLFTHFELDPAFIVHKLQYTTPAKGTTMQEYAHQMAAQIDTSHPFVLIGTSLGGMLAIEMTEFLHPEKVIILSSAKCRQELPRRYRFMKKFPLYKIVPPRVVKGGARILQPLVEPDRRKEKRIFKSMLKAKDPLFMKRSVVMIINWERDSFPENVVHIHGSKDHTLPTKNIGKSVIIEEGSHMMTLTRGKELSRIINEILLTKSF